MPAMRMNAPIRVIEATVFFIVLKFISSLLISSSFPAPPWRLRLVISSRSSAFGGPQLFVALSDSVSLGWKIHGDFRSNGGPTAYTKTSAGKLKRFEDSQRAN